LFNSGRTWALQVEQVPHNSCPAHSFTPLISRTVFAALAIYQFVVSLGGQRV
jgi:hypothetical protein